MELVTDERWRRVGFLVLAVVIMCVAVPALAHADVGQVLQNIIDMLNGGIVRSLAIIGVILTGLAWIFGFVDLRAAGMLIVGVALVFGAAEIVDMIAGT